jgi:hypothetical protein
MFRRFTSGALLVVVLLSLMAVGGATAAKPATFPGETHDDPFGSPHGLALRGTHGYEIFVAAQIAERSGGAKAAVEMVGKKGAVKLLAPANLAGEGIHANLGRYGRIDLRWIADGGVREVTGTCKPGLRHHYFFATGTYVGTLRIRGVGGFTDATAHRIRWRRSWYPKDAGCPRGTSEGFPGPGVLLEAGHAANFWEPVHLAVVENGPGKRVEYEASDEERARRMWITRYAYVSGGPKTLDVAPGFRTASISPPAPFSGTGSFERTEHATGTWLGDLSVEFPDHTELSLAGTSFEATLHSGFREVDRPAP